MTSGYFPSCALSYALSCAVLCGGLLAGLAAPARAAQVALCESAELTGKAGTQMYGPDGKLVTLTVTDAAAPPDCAAIDLPLPAEAVRWSTLTDIAPGTALDWLALQGYFENEVRVSEVIHAQPGVQNERSFLPFNTDLQPYLQARSFGVEERAEMEGTRFTCAAGDKNAGLMLRAELQWERLPDLELEIVARGKGRFPLAIADAAREAAENPLELGTLDLDGTGSFRYRLPDNAAAWTSLVLLCPATVASLELDSIALVPKKRAVTRGRATWLWAPARWRDTPESAWPLAERENLDTLYVTVPVSGTAVEDAVQLAAFIREARARDIAVWAVVGDRADVLPENQQALLARAAAYRAFNAEHPDAQLAGLQLDIEPYLLPGSNLAPDYWRERYVATVAAVQAQLAGALPLDLVMPVWWGTHPAWGSRLLDALAPLAPGITVMNYRTDLAALRTGAMPFFAWGQTHRRPVAMALEKGRDGVNIGNGREETRIDFAAAAERGELWLLELGGLSLVLLLDRDYAGLPGRAYAKSGERSVSIGTISFANAPAKLEAIAATLEAEWSAWDSFAGLAIHGLDQSE